MFALLQRELMKGLMKFSIILWSPASPKVKVLCWFSTYLVHLAVKILSGCRIWAPPASYSCDAESIWDPVIIAIANCSRLFLDKVWMFLGLFTRMTLFRWSVSAAELLENSTLPFLLSRFAKMDSYHHKTQTFPCGEESHQRLDGPWCRKTFLSSG